MTLTEQTAADLMQAAQNAAEKAYAPYSHFPVGAALLTDESTVVTGCNVENASYGLTLCAERVALVKAVSEGKRGFRALAVWAGSRPHGSVTPCGACRQMLAEFLTPEIPILYHDAETGLLRRSTMASLLPEAFGAAAQGENSLGTDSSRPGG